MEIYEAETHINIYFYKMDLEKFEKVWNAVKMLIKDNKVQSVKIAELEKKLFKQLDKAVDEEKKQVD